MPRRAPIPTMATAITGGAMALAALTTPLPGALAWPARSCARAAPPLARADPIPMAGTRVEADASLRALILREGQTLAGGRAEGGAVLPLERAAGGDTPVLAFEATVPNDGLASPRSVRLLLDTGAASTMVTPELAKRLGLTTTPLAPESIALAGGGSGCAGLRPQRTRLPELVLGKGSSNRLWLRGVEALVLPVAALPQGLDGVLGAPSLRQLPILIDPIAGRVVLGPAAAAPFSARRQPDASSTTHTAGAGALTVPLRWRQGVPLVGLKRDGARVDALADSGAEGLFLSPALAARLQPEGPAEPLKLVGVCGEQRVERRRFRGLVLPGEPTARPATGMGTGTGTGTGMGTGTGTGTIEGIVTENPVFAALEVEAIAGQEWLRRHRQLWRLDLEPPRLLLLP